MGESNLSRRKFIVQTSIAATGIATIASASCASETFPANSIKLGFIGTGIQSYHLLKSLMKCTGTVVVGNCDVADFNRKTFREAAERLNENKFGSLPKVETYLDFRDLLARKDIDAVVIATPDHWHAYIAVEAAKAGKDIYCEKPLASTVAEGRAMVNATRKYDRVFQTGNMQRSWREFRQACELVRNGYIGEIKEIKVNIGGPSRLFDIPVQETPKEIDWNMWVGPAEYRGYHHRLAPIYEKKGDKMFFPDWRSYRPYGGGAITDWGAHMFDIAQWGIGMDGSAPVKYIPPKNPTAQNGMKMIYENGIVMSHEDWGHGGVRFIGTKGTVDVDRGYLATNPESLAEQKIKDTDIRIEYSDDHYQNWIDAVKNRTRPICDVEIGHSTSALCNVVNIAYQLGRELEWDPKNEKFTNYDEANRLLSRPYRGEWKLETCLI